MVKINTKNRVISSLLIAICLCLIFYFSINNVNIENHNIINNIRIAGPISPISIDDYPGSSNDWTWASTQAWFHGGSGIEGDPYVLKDLIIDGGGVSNCITIENSIAYFKIQNCTVYNAGSIGMVITGIIILLQTIIMMELVIFHMIFLEAQIVKITYLYGMNAIQS